MHDNIQYIVGVTDVLCRRGHKRVDDFAEKLHITSRVVTDARNQICAGFFVLI